MKVRFSQLAKDDLKAAARYIAADNQKAARLWAESVRAKCAKLADNPRMGISKSDAGPDVRMMVIGNYVVFYETTPPEVKILRVLHGARQWEDLL
jgi:toxin ParE1/3/4